MSIFVVRHAKAGSRHDWDGDDDTQRPLTKPGRRQAQALAERFAGAALSGVWSSPHARCVQTVEPLAAAHGIGIVTDERLAEGAALTDILGCFAELPDGAVLCSHGDVIPDTMEALERRGCEFNGAPDWRKGSTWVLTREEGEIVAAEAWPPPGE